MDVFALGRRDHLVKIKIVHHSKYIGFSGTDRTAQLFCKYLVNSSKYEPFLLYRDVDHSSERLNIVREWLGDDHVIPYKWIPGKKGQRPPYLPEEDNFYDVVNEINPDILHIHRSGYEEFPGFRYLAPKAKMVETNIFGYVDPTRNIDTHIYISDFVRNTAIKGGGRDGPVLYNPILLPLCLDPVAARYKLINKFALPHNAVLLGRVGRADNFDPIALKAFKLLEAQFPNVYYIVVNPCNAWRDTVNSLDLRNVRFHDPIYDDLELSEFYSALRVYLHARSDGEACPCNIQEAMMHGLPVISHYAPQYNGQAEILHEAGFVVPMNDHEAYSRVLEELLLYPELHEEFSIRAKNRAESCFEASMIVQKLETIYDKVLA